MDPWSRRIFSHLQKCHGTLHQFGCGFVVLWLTACVKSNLLVDYKILRFALNVVGEIKLFRKCGLPILVRLPMAVVLSSVVIASIFASAPFLSVLEVMVYVPLFYQRCHVPSAVRKLFEYCSWPTYAMFSREQMHLLLMLLSIVQLAPPMGIIPNVASGVVLLPYSMLCAPYRLGPNLLVP